MLGTWSFSSVQSLSCVQITVTHNGLQHTRLPCPSPLPEHAQTHVHRVGELVRSNHLILCHALLLALKSFPESRSFPMSQFSISGGQSKGAWALTSVLPMNIQSWFALGLTNLILLYKGFSRVFFSSTVWKHQFFSAQPSLWSNSHLCTLLLEKPWLWLYAPLLAKWCLCFLICCLDLS